MCADDVDQGFGVDGGVFEKDGEEKPARWVGGY